MLQELRRQPSQPNEGDLNPGPISGICSPETIRSIECFQLRFMHSADGRVDPGGLTHGNLKKVTFHDAGACPAYPATARALVQVLLPHEGDRYVFGAAVPKENSNWVGPWDCAEFVAWGIYQISGRYVGCSNANAENGVAYTNAYSGYFNEQLPRFATEISISEAANTLGGIAQRRPCFKGHKTGHIAVSRGRDRTIEAPSTAEGVRSKNLTGRDWSSCWRLNFLLYEMMNSWL